MSDNAVVLQCFTNAIRPFDGGQYPLFLRNIKITAMRVDSLTNQPLSQIE